VLTGSLLALVAGLYLIARLLLPRPAALLVAVLVAAFPPVLTYGVLIGTDAWFTSFVVCGFGLAARCARTRGLSRTVGAVLAVLCAYLAQAARPTALPAVMAMLCALALVLLTPWLRGWRRALGTAVVSIVGTALVFGAAQGVDRLVLHSIQGHPEQETYDYDLVGMSIIEHRMLLPRDIYPKQDLAYLRRHSSPEGLSPLFWGQFAAIPPLVLGPPLDSLQRAWLTAIREQPMTYLGVRWENALWQLDIHGNANAIEQGPPQPPGFGYHPAFPDLHSQAQAYLDTGAVRGARGSLQGGPLRTAWVYVLVLLLAVVGGLASRRRTGGILALLALGILLYSVEIALFSPGVVFRYMYPAITAGTLLSVLLVVGLAKVLVGGLRAIRRPAAAPAPAVVAAPGAQVEALEAPARLGPSMASPKRIARTLLRPFIRPVTRPVYRRLEALEQRIDDVDQLAVRLDRHLPIVENAIESQNAELRTGARDRAQVHAELRRLRDELERTQRQVDALARQGAVAPEITAPAAPAVPAASAASDGDASRPAPAPARTTPPK
jgi:hypothetical protein